MTEETENTEVENETEVTYEEPESQAEGKVKQASNEDELDSYSKGVQSRIKKLTERYRQEERDKAEAVRLSQQLIEENNKLKTRVKALDTGYLSEYGSRLESQTEGAKRIYKEAYEAGTDSGPSEHLPYMLFCNEQLGPPCWVTALFCFAVISCCCLPLWSPAVFC